MAEEKLSMIKIFKFLLLATFRRDRNEFGGGLIAFIRNDLIVKRVSAFESEKIKIICTKITISKNKWILFSVYRPPKSGNLD